MRGARLFVCWFALAAAVLVALAWWQGQAYWEYSDGVYSLSARQLLDGQSLYGDFAAAQPPPLYYLAAAALAVSDSPASIRVLMALCEAAVSLLVLVAVRRLTRSSAVALCAAAVCFVTPWALREHAQLLPETLAAPLVMAAALAAGRRATSVLAGALGALAAAFKLAFVIPALAIVLLAKDVRRAGAGFAVAGLGVVVVFGLLFGEPLWTNVVRAQAQTGRASLEYVVGLWSQAGWNLLPLVVLAALGVVASQRARRSRSRAQPVRGIDRIAAAARHARQARQLSHGRRRGRAAAAVPRRVRRRDDAARRRRRAAGATSADGRRRGARSRWRSRRSRRSSSRPRTRASSRGRSPRRGRLAR